MPKRIIIVGGLAAGPAAASKVKRINPDNEVLLIEKSNHISYGICELPYFISNRINNIDKLFAFTPYTLQSSKGIVVKTQNELKDIDKKNREIIVLDKNSNKLIRYSYDKLILALGSVPKFVEDLPFAKNVFTFKSFDDALKLKTFIKDNKPSKAIVFGSGFIGLELAEALKEIGISVILFDKENLPMPYFENITRKKILELLNSNKIDFIHYSKISSFNIENNLIKDIEIDGKKYISDIIINAIGVIPNTEVIKGTGINLGKNNGIIVDPKMQTNIDCIFACGDCCEYKNLITLKYNFFSFANLAKKTGWIAGENAAGKISKFNGVVPIYGLKIFNYEFAHVGLTLEQAKILGIKCEKVYTDALIYPKMISNNKIHIEMIYQIENKLLLGAELFGLEGCVQRSNILGLAIYKKMSLEELSQIDMLYHPLLSPQTDPIHYCASLPK